MIIVLYLSVFGPFYTFNGVNYFNFIFYKMGVSQGGQALRACLREIRKCVITNYIGCFSRRPIWGLREKLLDIKTARFYGKVFLDVNL